MQLEPDLDASGLSGRLQMDCVPLPTSGKYQLFNREAVSLTLVMMGGK